MLITHHEFPLVFIIIIKEKSESSSHKEVARRRKEGRAGCESFITNPATLRKLFFIVVLFDFTTSSVFT